MEKHKLTINLDKEATAPRYFDDEMTRSAQRVVPLAPVAPASRQTWKICLVAGVALLCGVLGGLALGLRQNRDNNPTEVTLTPVSALEASAELPLTPVPQVESEPAANLAEPAPSVTPSPAPRNTVAAKSEREPEANSPSAKSETVIAPIVVKNTATRDPAPLNNGLVRPRRAANRENAATNFTPKNGNGRAVAPPQLSLAEPKP